MNLIGTFPKLSDAERQRIVDAGDIVAFNTGDQIIMEGEVINELMFIRTGNLRITRTYLDDLAAEFAGPLGPGEVVGELSYFDGKGASATLIADGPTEMLMVPRDKMTALLEADITFAARFFECLLLDVARKLRSTNQRVLPVPP